MITRIYTIFDSKTDAYMQPFYSQTDASAQRQFNDAVTDTNSSISKHPQDYTLFFIGQYNDENAELIPNTPISLGNGVEFQAAVT